MDEASCRKMSKENIINCPENDVDFDFDLKFGVIKAHKWRETRLNILIKAFMPISINCVRL